MIAPPVDRSMSPRSYIPRERLAAAALLVAALGAGCHRESPQATRDRAAEAFLVAQVADLKRLVATAESGKLTDPNHIAIGIHEDVVKQFLDASLPRGKDVGGRVHVVIESAQPRFRGNNAAVIFEATARGLNIDASARLEIAGTLGRFRIQDGRLIGDVTIAYFTVLEARSLGLAGTVLREVITPNLASLGELVPPVEIPVRLEESLALDGVDAGIVSTRGGVLPLAMGVAQVVPVNQRLWVFIDAKAGPWTAADGKAKKPAAGGAKPAKAAAGAAK
jgi:hypothetical protein